MVDLSFFILLYVVWFQRFFFIQLSPDTKEKKEKEKKNKEKTKKKTHDDGVEFRRDLDFLNPFWNWEVSTIPIGNTT